MFAEGYIGIAGIIGVGKSTLTVELARELGCEPILEEVGGNPYLERFYADMKTYAAVMQIWLLNHRFRQHKEFVARISLGKIRGVVQDRTIWEDTIFARMLNRHAQKFISDLDYATYLDLFDNMVLHELVYPQLLIYLDCKPETAMERIGLRGRNMERTITLDYLTALRNNYLEFLDEMQEAGVRILRLNWEEFIDIKAVARLVYEKSLKPANFFAKWVRPLRAKPEAFPLTPEDKQKVAQGPVADGRAAHAPVAEVVSS